MSSLSSKTISQTQIQEWNASLAEREPQKILEWALDRYQDRIALACSLSAEDTVLLHMMTAIRKDVRVFVLDTGRLHEKSYEVLENCRQRYDLSIDVYFPDTAKIEELVQNKGPFSFYESVANRKECCFIRKVEPLRRALGGMEAWITGLRREQSVTRSDMGVVELDEVHGGLLKFNPLLNWHWQQVIDFARKNRVPLHPLHEKGYPSIGCEPCTRAIEAGEALRAGRWWWESPETKECGLHK